MSRPSPQIICKSMFKDGRSTVTKEQFTDMWINLINQLEAGKGIYEEKRLWEEGRWEQR